MSRPTGLRRAAVKEEFVALTGDLEKGIMLNQFIYWSERIYDFDSFIKEERARAEGHGLDEINIEAQSGWIYKDMPELKEEIMFTSSISTMSRKLNDLVKSGWIDRRNNPKYKWDKRYQYRVNLNKISKDLFEIGYILQDYKVNIAELLKSSNLHSESSNNQSKRTAKNANLHGESSDLHGESSDLHGDRAISKITTETTSEITTFNHSPKLSTEEKPPTKKIEEKESERVNVYKQIISNIDLESFTEYKGAIEQAIRILYYADKPLYLNNIHTPPTQIRDDLKRLEWGHVDLALRDFQIASKREEINNVTAYLARCIYNSIFNSNLKLEAEINYNGY